MAFPTKMRPETIARRAKERAAARSAERATMIARLEAKARQEGAGSIWAEMLTEALARQEVLA